MSKVTITDHSVMLCMLAEHQDALDEAADTALIEYLNAQEFYRNKLQKLRDAIDMRDAMSKARTHVRATK